MTEVDADGAYDSVLEPGMAGVKVILTDDAGRTRTASTDADGTAVFTPPVSGQEAGRYRVQAVNPAPDALAPAVAGEGSGPAVIRSVTGTVDVSDGKDVTYTTGFWEPGVYCQENPTLVTCNLAKGDATGKNGLVSFAGEFTNTSPGGTFTKLTDNTAQQSVFGIGTDRTGNVYMGTLVKRHAEYGPAGPVNAVYRYNKESRQVSTFVTLPGTLTAHSSGGYLHDDAVYGRVGREGLGDVDLSGDGRTLYAVDLNDSRLYTVPVQGSGDAVTAGEPKAYEIPRPADCTGDWHPYGLGVRGKRVLVGGVCGAESTVTADVPWGDPAKLTAHVQAFDGSGFRELFRQRMNYPRGCAYRSGATPGPGVCDDSTTVGQVLSGRWEAWNERVPERSASFVSAPQPILSNIEIADNGDLVFGFRDRFADMQGHRTYRYGTTNDLVTAMTAGDVLRVCASSTGYVAESDGKCGALTGKLPGSGLGPGGGAFYDDVTVLFTGRPARHDQVDEGATVLQPYRKKLWGTVYDPYTDQTFEQGVRRWDSEKGAVEGNLTFGSQNDATLFGKANGLADLELLCDQAPAQIGDLVWFDTDGDGVRDPSEPPVAGVKVTLSPRGGGDPITVTTGADGTYRVGTAQGLKPDTTYDIVFDAGAADTAGLPGSPASRELRWTTRLAGGDPLADSDVDAGGRTVWTVGPPGHVHHGIDAGLIHPPDLRLTVRKKDAKTGAPLAGAVFELWRETNGTDGLQTTGTDRDTRQDAGCATDGSGRCAFRQLPPGEYYLRETAVPEGYVLPRRPVWGPYTLSSPNDAQGDGLVVTLTNERGEPCKGKC
ncbi:SdrD B-like domain-containing protein [Streptomyces sp. NPDC088757]|uniref:SdrD B-like domain-containing protein n=1 Tax=Streptomyces sp. NPDC088757 TaxID=3365889 RepID=UPI0037F91A5C